MKHQFSYSCVFIIHFFLNLKIPMFGHIDFVVMFFAVDTSYRLDDPEIDLLQ